MNEDKASRYHRLVRRAWCVDVLWTGVLLMGLLLTGASAALRDASIAAAGALAITSVLKPVAVVAFYVTGLAAMRESISLVVAYYRGHLIESRYGLTTQTRSRWFRTYCNEALVGFAAAQLGVGIMYFLARVWPTWWWLAAGSVFSLAAVALAAISSVLPRPLGHEFAPIEREELRHRLTSLARAAGTGVLGVYRWTLSDSTRRANAILVGIGRTRRILVSDTLLADYSDDELEFVLAHELGHHVHGDIWWGLALNTFLVFATFFLAQYGSMWVGAFTGVANSADVAGLPIVLLLFGTLSLVMQPFLNAWSRAHERRADRFALRLTRNPAAFASVMRRLARQNLAEERPPRFARSLFYAHPPFVDRVEMAREWDEEDGVGEG